MRILHSGFDSLYMSLQGALSPISLERLERLKNEAAKVRGHHCFTTPTDKHRYTIAQTGKRGGYTYLIDTGLVGHSIAFKHSLSRNEHNGFVEISSACLLVYGWRDAVKQALHHVKSLGFHVTDCAVNRVDYCIDFADVQIALDPRDFVTHSRVKKTTFHTAPSVVNHVEKRSVAQSDHLKSVTLGKMPGRQVIVYDKRAEVIERRKLYWFDAWGIDRLDPARTVHRVEVRAGKQHLLNSKIRTLSDFETHIGTVLQGAVEAVRLVQRSQTDQNISRAPLHPLWSAVQTHMRTALNPYSSPLSEQVITERMRENKVLEYRQQIAGNLAGWLGVSGTELSDAEEQSRALVTDICSAVDPDNTPVIYKTYVKAREAWDTPT